MWGLSHFILYFTFTSWHFCVCEELSIFDLSFPCAFKYHCGLRFFFYLTCQNALLFVMHKSSQIW